MCAQKQLLIPNTASIIPCQLKHTFTTFVPFTLFLYQGELTGNSGRAGQGKEGVERGMSEEMNLGIR